MLRLMIKEGLLKISIQRQNLPKNFKLTSSESTAMTADWSSNLTFDGRYHAAGL